MHYQLAISCLQIAAKYDELDCTIPFTNDFMRIASSKQVTVKIEAMRDCEKQVLHLLDWHLKVTTTFAVVELLLCQGVLHSTDKIEDANVSAVTASLIRNKILMFIDIGIQCKDWILIK